MRLVVGISKADITEQRVVFVAVAVIARIQQTRSLAQSREALSLVNEGLKLCDLFEDLEQYKTTHLSWTEHILDMRKEIATIQIHNELHQRLQVRLEAPWKTLTGNPHSGASQVR